MHLSDDTIIRRSPNMIAADVQEQVVLMGVQQGEYYSLNSTGSAIWHAIGEPRSFRAVRAVLEDSFDAPADVIGAQAHSLILELAETGIVELDSAR